MSFLPPLGDAALSGGFLPGGRTFAVDGDWTGWQPHGPPDISFPFDGDSIFDASDIVYLVKGTDKNWLSSSYQRIALGTYPNIQLWSPNQRCFIIDQKFRGSFSSFQSMLLNTAYNSNWAENWIGFLPGGIPMAALNAAFLVKEGRLRDIGGGLAEVERRFAVLPPTRNSYEDWSYNYIGLSDTDPTTPTRPRFVETLSSRLQEDYFVFDDLDLLPGIQLFDVTNHPAGRRLDSNTGMDPFGILLAAQKYYGVGAQSLVDVLFDDSGLGSSIPSTTQYLNFTSFTGNPPAWIVAVASTMRPWMGNIYKRCTRFVPAQ